MNQLFTAPDRDFYCVTYFVFALPIILFYTFFIPPFQVPDESSHFARAYQLTHGEFFPTRQQVPGAPGEYTVGGTVDPGIFTVAQRYFYLENDKDVKLDLKRSALANSIMWQAGEMRDIRVVAVYAPTFYAVPALGILLGQYADMSIVQSLTLSRLMNGLFSLFLISIAMFTLRRGHGVFFVLLMMPMTLAQVASTSQDSICFAAAALCVAVLSRLNPELPQRKRRIYLILSAVLMVMLASARPPYAALSLFYLYYGFSHRTQPNFLAECCMAFFAVFFATVLWSLYVAFFVSVPFGLKGFDYAQQALFMMQSPIDWLGILAESWSQRWEYYLYSFIGIVGHLDTSFPDLYYFLTVMLLCLTFLQSFISAKATFFKDIHEHALVPCVIVLLSIVGMFAVLYISWSPLKNPIIEGPQGRYFIPAALFLALVASKKVLTGRSQIVYRCVILSFAMGTMVAIPYVVAARYY